MAFVCLDIGGTNTLVGIGNGDFEVVEKIASENFLYEPEETLEKILDKTSYTEKDIEKVAVAAAGPIDRENYIFYPPNFIDQKKLSEVDLSFLNDLGEFKLINDCTSAALGEYHYGNHQTDNLVYITISSGIGAGVIINDQLIEGHNGNFGEIGHMEIGSSGLKCGCGEEDHWEAYCSGNNLPKMAEELYNYQVEDAKQIFEDLEEGSPKAEKVIDKMQEYNTKGILNTINLYNPQKIVLGGAVVLNHPEIIINPIREEVEEQNLTYSSKIEKCSLGERSVVNGLRAICNGKANL